jgi:hypothetical protein
MFAAAIFTIAKKCKEPNCSSTEEWINKIRYIYSVEHYSAMKMKQVHIHAAIWMNIENYLY